MEVHVQGTGPAAPFLSARDLFESEYDLSFPVRVRLRDDPDERTWAGHDDDRHVLNISRRAASSAMARELALHEFAHMARFEEDHPSHVQSTEEVLYLAQAAAADAPSVDADEFRTRFRELGHDPDPSGYRRHLVQATRSYVDGDGPAAD